MLDIKWRTRRSSLAVYLLQKDVEGIQHALNGASYNGAVLVQHDQDLQDVDLLPATGWENEQTINDQQIESAPTTVSSGAKPAFARA